MFSFAKSVIDTVFGRKRTLDDSDSVRVVKKQRVEVTTTTTTTTADNANYMYRLRVNNLPDREVNTSKKFFKGLGYNRFKKAPDWNYGFITFDVRYRYI
jgi:tRNA (uracil-5-)-methyltransferase